MDDLEKLYENITAGEMMTEEVEEVINLATRLIINGTGRSYAIAIAYLLGKRHGVRQERQKKKALKMLQHQQG